MRLRKKGVLAVVYILIVVLVFFLWLSYAKRPQNVFDQIYYELKKAEHEKDSILVSGTDSAHAQYDRNLFTFEFTGVGIPDLGMFLSEHDGYLHITFIQYNERGQDASIQFVYNPDTEKLYGERAVRYLQDNFLVHYFKWWADAGMENDYSRDNLGDFTFIASEKAGVESRLDDSE